MTTPVSAGDLRFRIRFDKKTAADDPAGGSTFVWTQQFIRWAAIIQQKGGEAVQAQRLQGTQPALIIVRYDSQTVMVDTTWRAVLMLGNTPTKLYDLKTAADMEGDRQFITMQAVSGDADA